VVLEKPALELRPGGPRPGHGEGHLVRRVDARAGQGHQGRQVVISREPELEARCPDAQAEQRPDVAE
jgi:hypothetical protein